ncbi:MAG: 4-hydroxythreonine-4-phosphate dehydrogenase PdxA [Bacteroidota bacterium]
MKPILAFTCGDFNGIGPEIALKSFSHPSTQRTCQPVLVGPIAVFESAARRFKLKMNFQRTSLHANLKGIVPVIDIGDAIEADITYGIPTKVSGKSAGAALEKAVELCMNGTVDAMVTAPSSKEALNIAGYNFPGQTEMIALLSRSNRVAMMLISPQLKIGLVTIHTAVRDVAQQITREKLFEKLEIVDTSLKKDFRIKDPHIAILALNPHAGEHGLIGTEEDSLLSPFLVEAKAKGFFADGPFPADGFFGTAAYKKFDAVLAMYHDQGLIPLKMLAFNQGVNFSAGLKIVRTSPDHGTAYNIAGKNKANLSSMLEAIQTAAAIVKNRKYHD